WHAAESLLAAARRDPNPNAFLIVEGAKAEVHARRYEHARQLLVGQPWLLAYLDGEALAVLAQAEFGTGRYGDAATHFQLARARALLLAGDTTRALDAFARAGRGGTLDAARLALATGDSTRARTLLYALLTRDPLSDDAAAGVTLALGPLPPRAAAEHVALARALNRRTTTRDARIHVEHALRSGDSRATTPLLDGALLR